MSRWLLFCLGCLSIANVGAGNQIQLAGKQSLNIGLGLKAEFRAVENQAPNGEEDSFDFNLPDVQLFTDASLSDKASFMFNLSYQEQRDNSSEQLQVMDAVLRYSFADYFKLWFGRTIVPADRVTLSGEFYGNAWGSPSPSRFISIVQGRDDGLVIWGGIDRNRLKYYVGLFEGFESVEGTEDNPLFAGRVNLNFWQTEPGYFTQASYYGEKEILSVGLALQFQKEAFYDGDSQGDYWGMVFDLLLEKRLPNKDLITLEAALYDYDGDNLLYQDTPAVENSVEGDGFFIFVAYLFSKASVDSPGRLQPLLRYQDFSQDLFHREKRILELGMSYIFSGYRNKVTWIYSETDEKDDGVSSDYYALSIGAQLLY